MCHGAPRLPSYLPLRAPRSSAPHRMPVGHQRSGDLPRTSQAASRCGHPPPEATCRPARDWTGQDRLAQGRRELHPIWLHPDIHPIRVLGPGAPQLRLQSSGSSSRTSSRSVPAAHSPPSPLLLGYPRGAWKVERLLPPCVAPVPKGQAGANFLAECEWNQKGKREREGWELCAHCGWLEPQGLGRKKRQCPRVRTGALLTSQLGGAESL